MFTQEIKGNLAKLLATENLLVEHRNCSTASFDVDRRVLTLPKWDKASSTVYDLLVGHEVGHALYTPKWDTFDCPRDYVNVTEDARIEKLMKRRYPGLRKSFFGGYSELHDQDFFGIEGEDLDTFKLIDRINLYFKIGICDTIIPFTPEEKLLVQETEDAETFDEAVAVAEKIWEFAKAEQKKLEELANIPQSGGDGGSSPSENQSIDGEEPDQQEGQSMTYEEGDGEEIDKEETETSGGAGDINTSDTQKSFDNSTRDLNRPDGSGRTTYVNIPFPNPANFIVDWTVIHDWINTNIDDNADFEWVDSQYNEFKKTIVKEVNYLVKEFECKKAADAYSRSMTSRTGMLATDCLHKYKFSDDLFKKVTILPEGKNHGMLFLLDWSGSMAYELLPTIKQLIILTNFCKKVGIPFEVYAFTNEWVIAERAINNDNTVQPREHAPEGEMMVSKQYFRLMNILSSRSSGKKYEMQCKNMFREVFGMLYYVTYGSTPGMALSGTPLNEAIVAMSSVIPQFQKTSGCQKVNLCILTDGDACVSSFGHKIEQYDVERIVNRRMDYWGVSLRDPKTGMMYKDGQDVTNILINNLKARNPGCNVIGFRLLASSGLSTFYNRYCEGGEFEQVQKQWKKEKSAILPKPAAFDALYVISAKTINVEETEMDVDAGATKTQVRSAFKKMLNKKKSNKKILNSFIAHVS